MTNTLKGAVVAVAALALTACGSDHKSTASSQRLPPTPCGTYSGRGCAPQRERVDLTVPSFTNPTKVTNPLFPISRLRSAVLLAVGLGHRRADERGLEVQTGKPPRLVAARMSDALTVLTRAVRGRKAERAAQAAIDIAQSTLDLELRYQPPAEIDAARFRLWTQQLRVDAAAKDLTGVTGDVAVLEWIRDRFANTLDPADRQDIDSGLRALRIASDVKNLPAAADHAARLASRLRVLGL